MPELKEIQFPNPDFDYDDPESPEYFFLPTRYEVCGRCRGTGVHTNPAIDGNGLTREDFDEDPSFREDYFNGVYDITCQECGGLRVVPVVDEERADKEILKKYYKYLDEEAQYEAMCRAERRAEYGGYDY